VVARLNGFLKRSIDGEDNSEYEAMQAVEYGSHSGAEAESRQGPAPQSLGFAGVSPFGYESTYAVACRRIRMTLSGLRLAVRSLLGSKGRKSLILYSEGFIRAPRVEKEEFVGLIDLARKAQVAIYYVDAAGLRTRSRLGPFPQPGKLTAGVEEETGGAIHVALQTGGRTSSSKSRRPTT
jgi:hypothetical protein